MNRPPDNPEHETEAPACAHCGLPVSAPARGSLSSGPAAEPVFCCAGCRLVHSLLASRQADRTISSAMLRLGLGIFFGMNVMAFTFCFYGAETLAPPGETSHADAALEQLFRWLLLTLASGVMLTLWSRLALDAWADLRAGRLQAGVLIAAGALAAYAVSALSVVRGEGPMYFDTASMILVLVTVGQYLEAKMKTAAARSAEGRLLSLPDEAFVESPQGERTVAVADLRPGEVVRVAAGSALPVDGEVVRGLGFVDAALLTGESEPLRCEPGSAVWAGSMLIEGALWVRVASIASERRIESILAQLHALRHQPTRLQRLADRVAAVFVPATLALAAAVFAHQWLARGQAMEGVMRALAVALIACPCALGLTAPLVVSRIAATLARRGVVVRSARSLELAASVHRLFFDKTGTLTHGDFRVARVLGVDPGIDALSIAAALERASGHPVARAFRTASNAPSPAPLAVDLEPISGAGVRGSIAGERWYVGRPASDLSIPADCRGLLPIVLTRDGKVVAWFGLEESIRPESRAVVDRLGAMGIESDVLTGDASERAAHLAATLNVRVRSGMTPESKRDAVRAAREESHRPVAFVGDGINDALALAEADLGVTVSGGSDLAHASGHASLLEGDLSRLVMLFAAARVARRRIALSLSWSFGYNSVGLALAAIGLLTPVFAAIAMVVSSAVTIVIAVRPIDAAIDGPVHAKRLSPGEAEHNGLLRPRRLAPAVEGRPT